MPKIKTRKNAAKRFKVTGTGKIVRGHSHKSHLNRKKSGGHFRRLTLESTVEGDGMIKPVRRMLQLGVPK